MVAPIYIIALALSMAFLLPLFEKAGKSTVQFVFLITLAVFTAISGQWLFAFLLKGIPTVQIFTAGVAPPLSINLQMGLDEAAILTAVNLLALLGGIYLLRHFSQIGVRANVLFLLLTLGLNGLVMTRDIFNVFVFLEITSISSYALIGMDLRLKSLSAGFKYMIAGSIASIFFLLGVIYLYNFTGTLNIDGMIAAIGSIPKTIAVQAAIFMLFFSFFIEMKQFPANGWALDVYQASHPGVSAMISAGSSSAIFYAMYKIMPVAGPDWSMIAATAGAFTFVLSNVMALKQKDPTRLLGYSSVGQMGFLLAVMGLALRYDPQLSHYKLILAMLFFNHLIAKSGLYWLAGIVKQDTLQGWRRLAGKPLHLFLFGGFIFALLGLPPFAGFWGKWALIMNLAGNHLFGWIAVILLGSLLEAVYLLRWLGYAVHGKGEEAGAVETHGEQWIPLFGFSALAFGLGYYFSQKIAGGATLNFIPLLAAAGMFFIDWLAPRVKGIIAIAAVGIYMYFLLPGLHGFALYFNILFLGGGLLLLFATLNRTGKSVGLFPLLLLMLGALSDLAGSQNLLQFFFAWELMTVSSYLLIIRGKNAEKSSLLYVIFSLGGAFTLLAGFAIARAGALHSLDFSALSQAGGYSAIVFILISIAFLVKTAAIGLHIWAPGAYAESDDDISPMISGILSKAGIIGFIILLIKIGAPKFASLELTTLLGWVGALTAFFATLFAVFQEDAKKLLAYSSVGQVGYIILGLAVFSHLGWVAALWHTLNHFLFKGLLFLAVAGVVYRTGTRQMFQMGGLIKRMPLSFVSVLIGIIALSGVPPLTGFGGKWLLYEALIEKGWYFQTGLSFFASTIAFLYCYRLIHTIFLGMPKAKFKNIKEAPVWFLIPQYVLIVVIMIFSVRPQLLIEPLSAMTGAVFPATLQFNQSAILSSLGYWNGMATMIIIGVIFVLIMLFLIFTGPRPQKVKPFNIVFAAEKPVLPETTHYAYNFFSPYRRAMGFLLQPLVKRFWNGVAEWTQSTGAALRQIYSGDMQTYAMFIFIFGMILFIFSVGVH